MDVGISLPHLREQLLKQGEIDEYTKCTILDMSQKVLEHIAAKFDNVKKGVKSVMGGQILEYEAKTILNEKTFNLYCLTVKISK